MTQRNGKDQKQIDSSQRLRDAIATPTAPSVTGGMSDRGGRTPIETDRASHGASVDSADDRYGGLLERIEREGDPDATWHIVFGDSVIPRYEPLSDVFPHPHCDGAGVFFILMDRESGEGEKGVFPYFSANGQRYILDCFVRLGEVRAEVEGKAGSAAEGTSQAS